MFTFFCLLIYALFFFWFFFMNVPDNIKAESVPTRTLCNLSLVSNLSLWYLYLLSDLHWGFRFRQTRKKSNITAWMHLLFFTISFTLVCLHFIFFFWKPAPRLAFLLSAIWSKSCEVDAALFAVPSCLKIKISAPSEFQHILHRHRHW